MLDDALIARVEGAPSAPELSPRHTPDRGRQAVADVPRTLTGKKLKVPVKRILMGAPPDTVVSAGALANPEALDEYLEVARGKADVTLR